MRFLVFLSLLSSVICQPLASDGPSLTPSIVPSAPVTGGGNSSTLAPTPTSPYAPKTANPSAGQPIYPASENPSIVPSSPYKPVYKTSPPTFRGSKKSKKKSSKKSKKSKKPKKDDKMEMSKKGKGGKGGSKGEKGGSKGGKGGKGGGSKRI